MAQLQTIESGVFHRDGDVVILNSEVDEAVARVVAMQNEHMKNGTLREWNAQKATSDEVDSLLARKRAAVKNAPLRAEIAEDCARRNQAKATPDPDAGLSASERLSRLVDAKMVSDKTLSYQEALIRVQMENSILARECFQEIHG